MAEIIGSSGSLEYLLYIFEKRNIHDFDSLESILYFQKNWKNNLSHHREYLENQLVEEISKLKAEQIIYQEQYKEMLETRSKILEKEKEQLPAQITKYVVPTKNPLKFLYFKFKHRKLTRRLFALTNNFQREVKKPFNSLARKIQDIGNKASYRENNFDFVVEERSSSFLKKIEIIKDVLNEYYTLLSGTIGEEKAIRELRKLPDSYTVFNDFNLEFETPIYNRKENDRINSIQIDHLVTGPSGVFIIETKNWSEDSLHNPDLFSPIKQLKRTGYALFTIINSAVSSGLLRLRSHQWGKKKISVRNILLMTGATTNDEFQFVKILTLNQINGYITYFNEIFNYNQCSKIVAFLDEINDCILCSEDSYQPEYYKESKSDWEKIKEFFS